MSALERFHCTLTLKQIFWKTKTFFEKLEYRLLVENTKIENVLFSYKTTISEASVKTNRMLSTKWTYHKERRFAVNTLFFWKFCFSLKPLIKSWFDVSTTSMSIFLLFVSARVLFDGAFSLWVTLKVALKN